MRVKRMIRRPAGREALYGRSSREVEPQTGVQGRYSDCHCDRSDQAGYRVGLALLASASTSRSAWSGWYERMIAKRGCHADSLPSAAVWSGVGWRCWLDRYRWVIRSASCVSVRRDDW